MGVDFCQESEEFDPHAEWSSEQLSGEVEEPEEEADTGSSGEDEELAEEDVSLLRRLPSGQLDVRWFNLRPEVGVRQRDEAWTSCWCENCAEAWHLQQAVQRQLPYWWGRCITEQTTELERFWYGDVPSSVEGVPSLVPYGALSVRTCH
jgi:hypothetical protein